MVEWEYGNGYATGGDGLAHNIIIYKIEEETGVIKIKYKTESTEL